jgi:eukaryotic-like serine/threonine-protein kinase
VSDLDSPTVVDGRYRILERVGSGGMADVFVAEDLQLGRNVALKILHRRYAEDREFVERFRREASSAAGLNHQHVVSVYDRGEYDGTYYIAMEYLDGRSLKQLVQHEGPLAPDHAVDLVVQILRAARFAHRRGIIHRDLKPHNVIVDDEGRAKVTDFGIARAGASDMTQTGSIMGTAQYLSPEQAQGVPVSAASDLYSIGIILYELLAGRVPFDGESAVTIALKHVNERPLPPSVYNSAVSPALDAVTMRALEKDPAARFRDADEFIAALEETRGATGATAVAPATVAEPPPSDAYAYPPEPLPPRESRTGWRRWWWVIALLAVVALLVGGFLLFGGGTKQKTVPAVVGADQASAEATLERAGFKTDAQPRTSSRPKGQVIKQDPSSGTQADEGSTVVLTVSAGPEQVQVPEVEGLTSASARKRLDRAGLDAASRTVASGSVEKGKVISSDPEQGATVDKGSTVTLTVSSGPKQVDVPDVTGRSFDAAQSQLQDAGFEVQRADQESTSQDPGTVLSQNPAGGSQAAKGATVTLTVAKAPAQTDVPDVTGEDAADAVRILSGRGFQVDQKSKTVDSPEGDGVVIAQSPSGGKADKGSTVTLTVGKFDPALNPEGSTTTTTPEATTTTPGATTTTPPDTTGGASP